LRTGKSISNKILSRTELQFRIAQWRVLNKKIVFTNGCFDILHAGHIASLEEACNHGDYLVVGLNADSSVQKLKGNKRPINDETSRSILLASLIMVDAVTVFSEETPLELIRSIIPDVLVKGGDYKVEEIAGAKEVIAAGGKVVINKIVDGFSTSSMIKKIQNQ